MKGRPSTKKLAEAIGAEVLVPVESWNIPMVIKDVTFAWGKTRVLVTPTAPMSTGEQWIDTDRIFKQWKVLMQDDGIPF
jgi:hypothetical protein